MISQMDYLDNLVWLYSIIRKYRIDGCEDALHFIEKRYDEYAYLALALEKMRNDDGNSKYSRTIIYEWIDNIRKMSLSQSFEDKDEKM